MVGNRFVSTLVAWIKRLSQRSRDTSPGSQPATEPNVEPDERISTFVYKPDHVVAKTGTIHRSRLRPRRRPGRERGRLELSVCRSQRLTDEAIWFICAEHFDAHPPTPATGRCDARAAVVYGVGLFFDPDGVPYPEHANVIGWHDDAAQPDKALKHHWMDQAQRMAPHFSFVARPR